MYRATIVIHFWSVPENFLGFIKLFKAFLGCSIPNRTFLPSPSIHINCLLPLFLAFDNSDVTVADRVDNYTERKTDIKTCVHKI